MKKLKGISKLLVLVLLIGLVGCSAEDGAVGPQGEAGANGTDGTNGADGTNGTDGQDGNANVIYSDWFFPVWNEFDAPRAKRMIVTNSEFGENYDDGVILFYWITNNGSTFLVPWNSYSTITGALNISRSMNVRGTSGDVWITIRRYDRDFEVRDTYGQFEGITYNHLRYVIIPGNVNVSGKSALDKVSGKSTLDYSNYETVKAFYKIPD
tara:strand:- start:422 stop:1051 length:630 start_codon:yes stop_codon:yes gene_type:complete